MANLFKDHDDLSRLIEISIKVASLDSGCLAYLNNSEILISNQKGEDFVLQNFQLKLKINEVIKNNKSLFQTFDSVPSTNSFTFICIPLAFSGQSTAKAALCLYSNEFCEIDDKTRLLLEELALELAEKMSRLNDKYKYDPEIQGGTLSIENFFGLNLDLLCIASMDGYFIKINDAWEKKLGFKKEQLQSKKFLEYVHPDDRLKTQAAMKQLAQHEEVINFTNRYIDVEGNYHFIQWHSRPIGELIYAAARDVSEYIKLTTDLKDSLERNQLLANLSMEGIMIHKNTKVIDINPAYERMSGFTKSEITGINIFDLVHPDDRLIGEHYATIKYDKPYEIRGLKKNGEFFYAELEARNFQKDGKEYRVVAIRDVSNRKIAQLTAETRMKMIEFSADHSLGELLTFALDYIGNLVDSPIGLYHFIEADQVNISLQQWSTNTLKEYCKVDVDSRHYPLDKAGVWADCVRERKSIIHNDYYALNHKKGLPSGHAALNRELVVPVMRHDKVVAILGVGNKPSNYTQRDLETVEYLADVTWEIVERKIIEENLRENEVKHRTLFNNSPDAYFLITNGKITDCNRATERMLGLEKDEIIGKTPLDFSPEFQANGISSQILGLQKLDEVSKNGTAMFEWQHIRSSGETFWAEISISPMHINEGDVLFIIMKDITEKKLTKDILEASEQRFQHFMNETPVFAYIKSSDLTHIYENQRVKELFHGTSDKLSVQLDKVFSLETIKQLENADLDILTERKNKVELVVPLQAQNEVRWLHDIKFPLKLPNGERAVGGLAIDVTDLKNATQKLERTANLLEHAQRIATMGAWDFDILTNRMYWTDEVYEICEATKGTVVSMEDALAFIHVDYRKAISDAMSNAISLQKPFDHISKLITAKGKTKWVRSSGQVESIGGSAVRLIGMMQDVTKQEINLASIKQEQEFSKMLIDNMADGFSLVDAEGKMLYVNQAFCEMTGFSEKELVGKTQPYPFWPKEHEKMIIEYFRKASRGKSKSVELKFCKKNGVEFPVIVNIASYNDENGNPKNYFSTIKDISKRKQMEEDLKSKLQYMQLLSSISSMAVIVDDLNVFLNNCLKTIGDYLRVDKIRLASIDDNKKTFTILSFWASKNKFKNKNVYQEFPDIFYPDWLDYLQKGEIINYPSLDTVENKRVKETLSLQHIKSVLAIPLFVSGRFFGFIIFEHCDRHYDWPTIEQDLMLTLSRIITGVFERKETLEHISKSEQRHRLLADNATDVIWTIDLDGKLTYVSPSVTTLLGYTPEEVMEISLSPIIESHPIAKYLEGIINTVKGGQDQYEVESKIFELQLPHKYKAPVWIESTVSGLYNEGKKIIGILGVNRDITERKLAADRISFQSAFQQMVAELSTDFISASLDNIDFKVNNMLEVVGKFFECDRCYLFLFDRENQTMTNTHEWCGDGISSEINTLQNVPNNAYNWLSSKLLNNEIVYIEDIDKMPAEAQNDKAELQRQGIKSMLNMPILRHSQVFAHLGFDSVVEKRTWSEYDKSLLQIIANILADALTKVDIEKAIIEAKDQANHANKAKSEFLAKMSHEIRTPLNGVLGFTDLLKNTALNDIQKQYLNTAHNSANTLLFIINDILDIAKIEADKMEIDIKSMEIDALTTRITDVVSFQANKKNLELIILLDPNLPEVVLMDELKIKQIIINLLNNAIKFTENGEVTLKIELLSKQNNKVLLRFSVKDTGIGIALKDQQRIFDAFVQVGSTSTNKYAGTGLGLTIANKLLNLMGSELKLISNESEGSEFYFDILMNYSDVKEDPNKAKKYVEKVLFIEPNQTSGAIDVAYAEALGFNAKHAVDPTTAIQLVKSDNDLDLIIFDQKIVLSQHFDQMLLKFKELQDRIGMKLLLLIRSNTGEDEIMSYHNLGIRDFLYKPVTPKRLEAKIRQLFDFSTNKQRISLESNSSMKQIENVASTKTILVAEDNPVNMMLVKAYLKEQFPQMIIIEAINGKIAYDLFEKHRPDMVITDIQMPEMNGYELSEGIRKLSYGQIVPIVAITAKAIKGEEDRCIAAGMNDILIKPVLQQPFRQTIKKWLNVEENEIAHNEAISVTLKPIIENTIKEYDKNFVLQLCGGKVEFYNALIKEVRDELYRIEDKLKDNSITEDLQKLGFVAHKLKGTAQSLKAQKLSDLARKIEIQAKAGEQVTKKSIDQLLGYLNDLRLEIIDELNKI